MGFSQYTPVMPSTLWALVRESPSRLAALFGLGA